MITRNVTGYCCSRCFQSTEYYKDIMTGEFVRSPKQSDKHRVHFSIQPRKAVNGRFSDSGAEFYQNGARFLAEHGFATFESEGGINLYAVFSTPIATIDYFGIPQFTTTTGKMIMANVSTSRHWAGFTGYDGGTGNCVACGRPVIQ